MWLIWSSIHHRSFLASLSLAVLCWSIRKFVPISTFIYTNLNSIWQTTQNKRQSLRFSICTLRGLLQNKSLVWTGATKSLKERKKKIICSAVVRSSIKILMVDGELSFDDRRKEQHSVNSIHSNHLSRLVLVQEYPNCLRRIVLHTCAQCTTKRRPCSQIDSNSRIFCTCYFILNHLLCIQLWTHFRCNK